MSALPTFEVCNLPYFRFSCSSLSLSLSLSLPTCLAAPAAGQQSWSAQDITLKPEQLIRIMQLVKEGKCTQEEAVEQMKQEQMQEKAEAAAKAAAAAKPEAPSAADGRSPKLKTKRHVSIAVPVSSISSGFCSCADMHSVVGWSLDYVV